MLVLKAYHIFIKTCVEFVKFKIIQLDLNKQVINQKNSFTFNMITKM